VASSWRIIKMKQNKYIGHESQICGVEEHRLIGGKGDGMHLIQVKNGLGLEFTVSADRCADISRLSFKGDNFGYFSANGYVAPSYYEEKGLGFLKSFTAGFLTTCGLTAVGSPCSDMGEELPLHGTIGNTPAEHIYWSMDEDTIKIKARINDSGIFARKLVMNRKICCSKRENKIVIEDSITNQGNETMPLMILYHMNMGYPLLSEQAILHIPSDRVIPRNTRAQVGIKEWNKIILPTAGFEEQCYFHEFDKEGIASIYNPEIEKGLVIRFDQNSLDYFTEWKMMGEKDYVLGLEPGNCHPDGRSKMREEGKLKFIQPEETICYSISVEIIQGLEEWI
jgi:galactose mutarotase-like enzyme